MINRNSRHNEGNFVATPEICTNLPRDIKETDVYCDWSCKLQSCIHPQWQPIIDITHVFISSLYDATHQLPTEDYWEINKIWPMDQGKDMAKSIATGNATNISDGSFNQYRGRVVCIIEASNNITSITYAVHDTLDNKTDQSSYRSELGRYINDTDNYPMCHPLSYN